VTLFTKDFKLSNSVVFMTRPCQVTYLRVGLQITEDFGMVLLFLETIYEERAYKKCKIRDISGSK